jgi:hypothetical protein
MPRTAQASLESKAKADTDTKQPRYGIACGSLDYPVTSTVYRYLRSGCRPKNVTGKR